MEFHSCWPQKDIVGTWAKLARKNNLRFGVTNHSAHSWHWFQTAYDYDPEGPEAGKRYDAYTLTKEDGKGKWWEGLDPQELYTGRNIVMPDGITTIAAANAWHNSHDRTWNENAPPDNPDFIANWFLRCQDLIDKYNPDLLYFDNTELPLGQAGLDIAAHFYNANIRRHGSLQAVLNSKGLKPEHVGTMVLDIERGSATEIRPDAWQTDTCIGSWHYERRLFDQHRYKTTAQVIQMLIDIVSKNGNLLLNIPLRGDGSIDDDELKVLHGIAEWMGPNGQAIFATRPWKIYGEGPSTVAVTRGQFGGARDVRPYTPEDFRFTAKGETLFAFAMGWPTTGKAVIKSSPRAATNSRATSPPSNYLATPVPLQFTRTRREPLNHHPSPKKKPNDIAYAFKITPQIESFGSIEEFN